MRRKSPILFPTPRKALENLGQNLKLARLRRNYTTRLVAEKAGITRATLYKIEKGDPSVAIGYYMNVLLGLGLIEDMFNVAKDDKLGRTIQDLGLTIAKKGDL